MKLRFSSFSTNSYFSRYIYSATSSNLKLNQNALFPTPESLHEPYALNKILSWCSEVSYFSMGVQLHSHVIKTGFNQNVHINTSLVNMYGKCEEILWARKLFDEMPERNAVTWSALISSYVKVRDPRSAVEFFVSMTRENFGLTPYCISAALVACAQLEDFELGAQVHDLSLKMGLEFNVVVGSSLIDFYAKCWNVELSTKVFDGMVDKNAVAWKSIIGGYAYNNCVSKSMILMRKMLRSGLKVDYVTYNTLLSSFHLPDDYKHCCQIHCRVIQEGLESNSFLVTTLLTVYSESPCSIKGFYEIISTVTVWSQIAWNAVIAGFSNFGVGEEAFMSFRDMRLAGVVVDSYTFSSVLKALGKSSALEEGKQIHALLSKTCYVTSLHVHNGLVSMYARCGKIDEANKVFSLMDEHDLVSWNSLLTCYAQHGRGIEAIQMFERMRRTGVSPNPTTFLAALTACSHAGLLEKGMEYFSMMKSDYSLEPRLEHYTCIVDLYCRAGFVNEAETFINSMPIERGPSVYKALLSACRIHGNKEIALRSARQLVELCPDDPAVYVLLANVLANEGSWADSARVRKLLSDKGVMKKPGCSRI